MTKKFTNAAKIRCPQQLCSLIVFILCLSYATKSIGQLSYTYGWEPAGLGNWNSTGTTADEFERTTLTPCSGNASATANAYDNDYALLNSPNLGTSNGETVSLGYNYKAVEFGNNTMGAPAGQVLIEVQYASAASGPWVTVQTINNANHTVSASCAFQSVTFTPQAGNFFLRFKCTAVGNASILYYIDNLSLSQGPLPSCGGPASLSVADMAPASADVNFSPSPSGAADSYDYYLSTTNTTPLSTAMPTGSSAASPIVLSGLLPATTYYIWVRSNCAASGQSAWNGLSFTTKIVNDNATEAISLVVNQGCTGNSFTNINASRSSDEPYPSCIGTRGYAVSWFKFIAPSSGAVKISCDGTGGTIGNTKMALFSVANPANYSTFTILGCDNDNGVQTNNRSLFYSFGLTPGTTYYIAMDVTGSTQSKGTFCLTVDEFSATMLSSATGDCLANQNGSGSSIRSTYNGWTSMVDNAGNLVANVRGISNSGTQNYTSQLTVKTGILRKDQDGTEYMNRNFLITGSNTSSAEVQLFFTNTELTAMGGDIAALRVTRVSGSACAVDFQDGTGSNTLLTPTANGTVDGVNYIQFTTPGFSNFYIMKGNVPLPITFEYFRGSKTDRANRLDWKLNNTEPGATLMVLERSEDGARFTTLQEQKISSRDNSVFSYTDRSMQTAVNHYRVRLTGQSGKQFYSRIVTLANAGVGYQDVSIVPNPASNSASLQIAAIQDGKITIVVSDIAGKVLVKKEANVEEGTNDIKMDLSYLNAGTYQLLVSGSDGASRTLRFVKYQF